MPRVFLSCSDSAFCRALRNSFQAENAFVVCGETKDCVKAIRKAVELVPDLVIVETEMRPKDGLQIAEAIKVILPETPLFLVTEQPSVLAEKEALSRGIDAVFEKNHDFSSLIRNARAVCGLE